MAGSAGGNVPLNNNTWQSSATNSMATADVYNNNGTTVITSVKELTSTDSFDLAAVLRGGADAVRKIPTAINLFNQGQNILSAKDMTTRILGSSNLAVSAIKSLTQGAQDGILGTLKDEGKVFATINGVVQQVGSTHLNDVSSIGRTLNSLSGNKDLFALADIDGQSALYAGFINQATAYGVPNTYKGLTNTLTSTPLLRKIVDQCLPTTVAGSDHRNLKDMSDSLGTGQMYKLYPNVMDDFSTQYNNPMSCTREDELSNYGGITSAYSSINPSWNSYTRTTSSGTDQAVNISNITKGSADFQSTIRTGANNAPDDSTDKYYLLASSVDQTDVDTALSKQYPMTVPTAYSQSVKNTVNPTALNMGIY